jgi:signal peptidase I
MSNTPNNPFDPPPQDKGPWLYSGAPTPPPQYIPPTAPAAPTPPPSTPAPEASQPPSAPPPPSYPPLPKTTWSLPSKPRDPKKPPTDDNSIASIVDTIEAIIVALILALTFRAFVVEAFVIPTGSMAPTLLGAHFNVICPKCGYVFTRDASLRYQLETSTTDGSLHIAPLGNRAELTSNRIIPADGENPAQLNCPNCQYHIPYETLPQYLGSTTAVDHRIGGPPTRSVPFAWANNGDRILVMKYLYAFLPPTRFDVIVFKEPRQGRDNYIKRLIGLPNETIEVINGDVFIAPPGKTDAADLVIARKPPEIQKAVWQLVYDNDYYPIDQNEQRADGTTWTNPWEGAGDTSAQWSIRSPVLHYAAAAPGMIQFALRDPYTFNTLGYNNDINELSSKRGLNLVRCGDLHLETVWSPTTEGPQSISLTVGKPHNEFRATWTNNTLTLDRFNTASHLFEKVMDTPVTGPTGKESHHVVLDNVDHSIRVFIDNTLVLTHDTPWSAADALSQAQVAEAEPLSDLPDLRIEVGGPCTIAHLKVFRDLYYTQNDPEYARSIRTANAENPLTLGPDEFFAMGDNSRLSADGRVWEAVNPPLDDLGTRIGIVPRRYLLGKAFFVYWPAGFRPSPTDALPNSLNIPLIPNTGDMRLIR